MPGSRNHELNTSDTIPAQFAVVAKSLALVLLRVCESVDQRCHRSALSRCPVIENTQNFAAWIGNSQVATQSRLDGRDNSGRAAGEINPQYRVVGVGRHVIAQG